MKGTYNFRRGDIYLVDLGKKIGSEQSGCRPVVVIQNNVGNHYGPTLIVAPITSQIGKKTEQPTHCRLDSTAYLTNDSMVLLEQITTIDKCRIKKYMGTLDEDQMRKIDACIEVSLGLLE